MDGINGINGIKEEERAAGSSLSHSEIPLIPSISLLLLLIFLPSHSALTLPYAAY